MRLIVLAAALLLWNSASAEQAVDLPNQGGVLALSCAACHGTDGQSSGAMPALQGHSAAFIRNRMLAFRSGKRRSTVMGRIAKGYDEAEIALIAEHFASMKQEGAQ